MGRIFKPFSHLQSPIPRPRDCLHWAPLITNIWCTLHSWHNCSCFNRDFHASSLILCDTEFLLSYCFSAWDAYPSLGQKRFVFGSFKSISAYPCPSPHLLSHSGVTGVDIPILAKAHHDSIPFGHIMILLESCVLNALWEPCPVIIHHMPGKEGFPFDLHSIVYSPVQRC